MQFDKTLGLSALLSIAISVVGASSNWGRTEQRLTQMDTDITALEKTAGEREARLRALEIVQASRSNGPILCRSSFAAGSI